MREVARVKGIALKNFTWSLEHIYGPDSVTRVLERLPEELADGLRYGRIVASAWYPVTMQATALRAAAEVTGGGLPAIKKLGSAAVLRDLKGPYRVFLNLLGAGRSLAISTRFFNRYYDRGRASFETNRPGHAILKIAECDGFGAHVFANITGAAQGILEALGAKDVRVHIIGGGSEDDDWIEIEGHWL